jgi:hypothetical protein
MPLPPLHTPIRMRIARKGGRALTVLEEEEGGGKRVQFCPSFPRVSIHGDALFTCCFSLFYLQLYFIMFYYYYCIQPKKYVGFERKTARADRTVRSLRKVKWSCNFRAQLPYFLLQNFLFRCFLFRRC